MPQSHGVHDFAMPVHSARSSWFVTLVQQDASKTLLRSSLSSLHHLRQEKASKFNVHGSVHRNNILVYNSNKMHKSQNLFSLTTALHVSGVTITHRQEHKTTVTTASGNRYTVTDRVKLTDKEYR